MVIARKVLRNMALEKEWEFVVANNDLKSWQNVGFSQEEIIQLLPPWQKETLSNLKIYKNDYVREQDEINISLSPNAADFTINLETLAAFTPVEQLSQAENVLKSKLKRKEASLETDTELVDLSTQQPTQNHISAALEFGNNLLIKIDEKTEAGATRPVISAKFCDKQISVKVFTYPQNSSPVNITDLELSHKTSEEVSMEKKSKLIYPSTNSNNVFALDRDLYNKPQTLLVRGIVMIIGATLKLIQTAEN